MSKEKEIESLCGEYDPPFDFESEPTEEDIRRAELIIEKCEKLATEKNRTKLKMNYIANYTEGNFEQKEYCFEDRKIILSYLKKFSPSLFTSEPFVDVFSGKTIRDADNGYSDGEYVWYDSDIYYFEHYNLKLDEAFIDYVLKNNI